MDNAFATRSDGMWVVLPVLLVLLLVMNAPPYVPLQDYNEWVYQGYVAAQMLQGHLTGQFALTTFPVPNSAIQAVLCLLSLAMPVELAARIVASLYVVAAVTVAWRLSTRISPAQNISFFFVLLVCVFFNSPFWDGYMNYQLGILLFSVWLLLDPATRRKPLWVLAFSVGAFFSHAMIWASILLFMAIDAVRRRKYLSYLPALFSLGLFVWYAACKHTPSMPDPNVHARLLRIVAYKLYTLAKLGPYHNFLYAGDAVSTAGQAGYYIGVAVNFAVAAGVLYVFFAVLRRPLFERGGWKRATDEQLAALTLLALFVAMPAVISDLVNPGERVLYPALLLTLMGAGHVRVVRLLSPCVVVLAVCALGLVANGAKLLPEVAPAHAFPVAQEVPFFQTRPGAYYDVRARVNGAAPIRALGFETSFLFNRSRRHGDAAQ